MAVKTDKELRFLDLLYRGRVAADEIGSYVAVWHAAGGRAPHTGAALPLHVYLGLTWTESVGWELTGQLPTEAEHYRVPNPDHVALADGRLLAVHGPQSCRAPCPVHAPSDHPLRDAPKIYRSDRSPTDRIMERVCEHGTGHPDPDDLAVRRDAAQAVHECCMERCCSR